MNVYEYLAIGDSRPEVVRMDTLADAIDALQGVLRTDSGLPLLIAYSQNEAPKARAVRWHQVMQWLIEPLAHDPEPVMFTDWTATYSLHEELRQLTENTLVLLSPPNEVLEAFQSHRDMMELWARSLDERMRIAEAAETALWADVMDVVLEPAIHDSSETDAAAFQRAVQRRDWLVKKELWLTSDAIAKGARGAVVDSNANQYAYQLRQTGQILGVRHQRQRLHPACQFDTIDGRLEPLPVMRPLLELLPKDDSGWTQAFWLFQPTGRLQSARPADVLATRHDDVLLAAKKDFHGDDGI